MKKKLLITGASGFLGYHLLRVAYPDWDIYGVSHSKQFDFEHATQITCDITSYIELGNFIDDIEPDAVIHTAAIADANFCQNNREKSYSVNVEASINLAGICSDFQIPFAYTSTDLVFDGKKGMYAEEDDKNPLSVYGEQKAIAEDEVLKIYPEATIFRLPLMFGHPEASAGNYLHNFLQQIRNGEPASLFTDEFRSVCGARSICNGILQLFENNQGIIHLAGREKLSRYDFGMKVLRTYGLAADGVRAISQKEIKMPAPRPADVSLSISKSVHLGYSPLLVSDELQLISEQKYFE